MKDLLAILIMVFDLVALCTYILGLWSFIPFIIGMFISYGYCNVPKT